ncbi:MAG: glycosyltransferase family 39 protein [candidate division Zixibacteria bacterium]|nr:glycosyltransferase family 39 protein [candidate division Zixibacteria bacterium]
MRKNFVGLIKREPLLFILLIGGIVRLAFLLIYLSRPEWNQLLVDSLFHNRWAESIASGNILGSQPFFRAPFYIYLLGGLYALFGDSLLVARIFGHLVGLLSVYITYRLALRLFSKETAIVAALIHSLYPIAIYFESELLVESLFTLLVELSVFFLFLATDKKNNRWYFLTGLIFGIAVITRPVILPLLLLFIVWILWKRTGIKAAIISNLVLICAVVIIILPVTLRNIIVGKDVVLVASSGGINFYIGNNPTADGLSATLPPPLGSSWEIRDINYIAENEVGHPLKDSELSDYWYKKGLRWCLDNKIDFLKLYFKKLYFCLNNFEIPNNRNLPLFFRGNLILKIMPLNFGILFALLIISLILLRWNRGFNSEKIFMLLFITAYFILLSFFFINARFRLPVVPFIIIFASFGFTGIISQIISRPFGIRTIIPLLAGVIALIFAEVYFRREIDAFPYSAKGYSNLASLLYLKNLPDSARLYADSAIILKPYLSDGYLIKFRILAAKYDTSGLARLMTRAKEYFRDIPRIYLDAGLVYSELKMYSTAEKYLKEALQKQGGFTESSDEAFSYSTDNNSGERIKARAAYQLGYIYGINNQLDSSVEMSRMAIALDSNLIEAYINLAQGYFLQGEKEPADSIIATALKKFPKNELVKSLQERLK